MLERYVFYFIGILAFKRNTWQPLFETLSWLIKKKKKKHASKTEWLGCFLGVKNSPESLVTDFFVGSLLNLRFFFFLFENQLLFFLLEGKTRNIKVIS